MIKHHIWWKSVEHHQKTVNPLAFFNTCIPRKQIREVEISSSLLFSQSYLSHVHPENAKCYVCMGTLGYTSKSSNNDHGFGVTWQVSYNGTVYKFIFRESDYHWKFSCSHNIVL